MALGATYDAFEYTPRRLPDLLVRLAMRRLRGRCAHKLVECR